MFLGSFPTETSAAKAHDVAALRFEADYASAQQVNSACSRESPVLSHSGYTALSCKSLYGRRSLCFTQ